MLYRLLLADALELSDAIWFQCIVGVCAAALTADAARYLDSMFELQAKADQQLGSRMLPPTGLGGRRP
jgi:hypothetical protein